MSAPVSSSPRPAAAGPAPASAAPWWAAASLVVNAFVWGVSWWPVRELDRLGLHPIWASAVFFLVASLGVLVWRPAALPRLLRDPGLWVLAAASGLTNASFNWALTLGEVVRVVLLFYLMPLWAVFLARWLLDERLTRSAAWRVVLALVGALLVLRPADGGWPTLSQPADWLGVLGGMGFALTNVMLRRLADRPAPARALAMFAGGLLVPAVLGGALAAATVIPWLPAWGAAWVGGAVAMGAVFLAANLALQHGAARMPVHAAAVIMLTEILFAAVSAAWIGGETLGRNVLAGGALILSASLLAALSR